MCRIARQFPKLLDQVRLLDGLLDGVALQVYRIARQTTNLLDEVRFLGGALDEMFSECAGFARDPAKVEGPTLRVGARFDSWRGH